MKQLWTTFTHDKMLIIASVIAFLTMLIVPPDRTYLSYFNGRTLVSMWLLMMVIAGLRRNHFFRWLARRLLQIGDKAHHVVLALLFFAFAMATFVTNDVAIFITLPLAMRTLRGAGLMQYGAFVAVLVGLAANCGSMLTPIGNPQNMFLFSATQLTAMEILKTTGPFALLAAFLMYRRVSARLPHTPIVIQEFKPLSAQSKRNIALYLGALLIALLAIGNVLPLYPTAGVLFILTYLIYPHTHRHVDYGLLLTLCAFFVIAGNAVRMDGLAAYIVPLLTRLPFTTALVLSQCISDVPTAILLEPFGAPPRSLLLGVNLGAWGSPVASLASLIVFRLYKREKETYPPAFWPNFIRCNARFFFPGLLLALLLGYR